MSSSTAWNAGRLPWTSESTAIRRRVHCLQCPGQWKLIVLAAAAGGRRGGGRGRGGDALLRPRSGADRARPRSSDRPTSAPPSSTGRSDFRGPQRVLGLAGARASSAGTLALLAAAPAARGARACWRGAAAPRAARPRGGALAGADAGRPAARGGGATSAPRRRACRPRTGARWLGDVAKSAGDRGGVRGARRGRWRWR